MQKKVDTGIMGSTNSSSQEPSVPVSPDHRYRDRRRSYEVARLERASRSRWLSRGRSAAFLSSAGLLVAADVASGPAKRWLAIGGLLALVAFLTLVILHRRSRREETWFAGLASLCDEGLARLARQWEALPKDPDPLPPSTHPYARDLDLFGRASLIQLLGTVATGPGRARLRGWLLGDGDPLETPPRQEAVRELAGQPGFRDLWTARGRQTDEIGREGVERVVTWAGGDPPMDVSLPTVWLARAIPVFTLGLLWVELDRPGGQPAWLIPLGIGLWILGRTRGAVSRMFAGAGIGEAALSRSLDLVREAESLAPSTPLLVALRESLGTGDESASRGLQRLGRWVSLAEVRLSQLHFPLNVLLLWDIHVAVGLDGWRRRWGPGVGEWIDALSTLDALSALACLAHDHPDWCFPVIAEDPVLKAKELGHPLLSPPACVRNDVTLGPPGTVLLVTGSNMSGKSTLLRAIGVNVVLARAGGPVCAKALSLPRVRLATCMRVEDSLADGTSLFMAELERLKAVVEAAMPGAGPGCALFLLDEILHGTNTAERQIAARMVLKSLVGSDALGAISTHDLELAATAELEKAVIPVHFREEVTRTPEGRPLVDFDYLLRPGPATSTNALTLLEVVGLRPPDASS